MKVVESLATPAVPCGKCHRRHRTWSAQARCRWPQAIWIAGNGPLALLAHCGELTVTLWAKDDPKALQAKRMIDELACGGRCWGASGHEFVRLDGAR
jgi:hypothetical protein